jgi:hypothetical protein
MRIFAAVLVGVLSLGLATAAQAQQGASSILPPSPQQIPFSQINPVRAMGLPPSPMGFAYNLGNFFKTLTAPITFPPIGGATSVFPNYTSVAQPRFTSDFPTYHVPGR